MKFERDDVELLGGVRHGRTIGAPVAVRIGNTEWPKWELVMSADPVDPSDLEGLARAAPLTGSSRWSWKSPGWWRSERKAIAWPSGEYFGNRSV